MIAWIFSPGCNGNRLTIGMPFAVRSRSGISSARRRYTLPKLEKNSRWACAVVKMTWRMMSSAFSLAPATPRPPRACVLNEPAGTALTYCASVITTTSSLSSTRSSIDMSPGVERDLAHARGGEPLLDGQQLVLDHAAQQLPDRRGSLPARCDPLADVGELGLQVDARQPGQLAQLHVEDVDGLELAELERLGHQPRLGGRRVVARPDQGDDLVDDVERLDPALEDVLAVAGLVEPELRAPGDHLDLVARRSRRAPA